MAGKDLSLGRLDVGLAHNEAGLVKGARSRRFRVTKNPFVGYIVERR